MRVGVAVLGGGPAGVAAALELAEGGADCVVIDAYPEVGGHFYRRQLGAAKQAVPDERTARLESILEDLESHKVKRLHNTTVWAVSPPAEHGESFEVHLAGEPTSPRSRRDACFSPLARTTGPWPFLGAISQEFSRSAQPR